MLNDIWHPHRESSVIMTSSVANYEPSVFLESFEFEEQYQMIHPPSEYMLGNVTGYVAEIKT